MPIGGAHAVRHARSFCACTNKHLHDARERLLCRTMSFTRGVAVAAVCVMATRSALAEPERTAVDDPPVATSVARRHSIYLEGLGKGGLWGLGYGYQFSKRVAIGGVASMWMLDGQRVYTASPFLTVYPAGTARHRLFVDVGPQVIRVSTPSPVPEWMGTSSTGVGGQVSLGYERRGPLLVRAFAMCVAGEKGVAPWIGIDMGASF
jgi:hypothetical protein